MTYKYPHFEIWSHYLGPIEIAYVILWSYANEETFTNIESVDAPNVEIEKSEDSGTFEYSLAVPENKKGEEQTTLNIDYSYSGGWYGGSSGSYLEEPEPPTVYLKSLDVENMLIYTSIDEFDITPEEVIKAKVDFTYKDMIALATKIGINTVAVDEIDSYLQKALVAVDGRKAHPYKPEAFPEVRKMNFSQRLKNKIDSIFNNKDFKIKITSKKYGL